MINCNLMESEKYLVEYSQGVWNYQTWSILEALIENFITPTENFVALTYEFVELIENVVTLTENFLALTENFVELIEYIKNWLKMLYY